jgi:Restriction endonuclease
VSAKFRIAGAEFLLLIECKCYNKKVSIYDVLAFAQRIDDIGAQKGIMVTKVGYQDGAIKIATSKKIALVVSENQESWGHVAYQLSPGAKVYPPMSFKRIVPSARAINLDSSVPMLRGTSLRTAWQEIIYCAIDPTGDMGFNLRELELKKLRIKREKEHNLNLERLEARRLEIDPTRQKHDFSNYSDICKKCGCSLTAVIHFGWWPCSSQS